MLRRITAALALFTFLFYGGWSEARPCAMHDGMLAQMAMHGDGAIPSPHEMPAHDTPGHDGSSHHCTCIGSCGTAHATALPSPHIGWAAAVPRPTIAAAAPAGYIVVARAHARPWSTAPPRATRIA